MNMRQICTSFMLCTLVCTSSLGANQAHAQTAPTSSAAAFSEAMGYYELGKWAAAYGRFAALADRGHADAARIALYMYRFGPSLYASEWDASKDQIERWLQLVSRHMANMKGAVDE